MIFNSRLYILSVLLSSFQVSYVWHAPCKEGESVPYIASMLVFVTVCLVTFV